jgi:stage II sporulation protein AA (anti-sigma F factor antagonist)
MLTHEKKLGTLTVRLSGDLDHHTAVSIRQELDRLLADKSINRLIFNLKDLRFMDSSGIGMMIGRYKMMARRGGSVAVCSCGRQIDRLMELSGLYRIIEKVQEEVKK